MWCLEGSDLSVAEEWVPGASAEMMRLVDTEGVSPNLPCLERASDVDYSD